MEHREGRTRVSRYKVYVTPAAWKEIKNLPGHQSGIRRLRLDRWRIIYAITEAEETVDVLAVRKRPPYDYGDLQSLLKDYPSE